LVKEIPNEVVFIGVADESLGQKLMLIIEGNNQMRLLRKFHNSI
jgi:O-succinylbenzoic acid--CoA ligase